MNIPRQKKKICLSKFRLPKVIYEQSTNALSQEAEGMVQEAFNFLFEKVLENYNKKHSKKFGQSDSIRSEIIKIPPNSRGEGELISR